MRVHHVVHNGPGLGADAFSRDVNQNAPFRLDVLAVHIAQHAASHIPTLTVARNAQVAIGHARRSVNSHARSVSVHHATPRVLGNTEKAAHQRCLRSLLGQQHGVPLVQLQLPVVPPVYTLANVHRPKQTQTAAAHSRQVLLEAIQKRSHPVEVGSRLLGRHVLRLHQLNVPLLRKSQRHPQVRVRVQLALSGRQLRGKLRQQRKQHRPGHGKRTQRHTHRRDRAKTR
mmetsp:Transcript_8990/g.16843  ORF Transcript_8990/g.16843 Transcript_8990/m.16843 type:complete len:228 (-) Transcript_8990:457-1140(-)